MDNKTFEALWEWLSREGAPPMTRAEFMVLVAAVERELPPEVVGRQTEVEDWIRELARRLPGPKPR